MVGRRVHRSTIATAYERGAVNPSMNVSAGLGSTLSHTLLSFVLYASDAVPPHQFCPYMVLCRHWCASRERLYRVIVTVRQQFADSCPRRIAKRREVEALQ